MLHCAPFHLYDEGLKVDNEPIRLCKNPSSMILWSCILSNKSSWERNVRKEWAKRKLRPVERGSFYSPDSPNSGSIQERWQSTIWCLYFALGRSPLRADCLLHSSSTHFLCPEPEAPGVGAKKEDFHKIESPTEMVGQSLNHKQLEVLRIVSLWGAALQIAA